MSSALVIPEEEEKAGSFGIAHSNPGQIHEPGESCVPIKGSISGGILILPGLGELCVQQNQVISELNLIPSSLCLEDPEQNNHPMDIFGIQRGCCGQGLLWAGAVLSRARNARCSFPGCLFDRKPTRG